MKKVCLLALLLTGVIFAYPPLPEAQSEAEALFVRRIVDFWRDQEYPFAKAQIEAFFEKHEKSAFTDHFHAMLGDIALHEKHYEEALTHYARLENVELIACTEAKRWQALYQLKRYDELYGELQATLLDEEGEFYLAEAAFRIALTSSDPEPLFHEAIPLYTQLLKSARFSAHAKLALAEIHRALGDHARAATLYLEIANTRKDDDEVLFHAAALLAQCDKERAISLFESIARGSSPRASDAAYQWLQMLALSAEWEVIESERTLWLAKIHDEQLSTPYFYLGMIAFEKKRYLEAIPSLEMALEKGISAPHDRTALEALLSAASETGNLPLCEANYEELSARYPENEPQAALVRAVAHRKAGDLTRALELCAAISTEPAAVEEIDLLIALERWEEAHTAAEGFLSRFPESNRSAEMLCLSVDLCTQLPEKNEELIGMLERAFAARLYTGNERQQRELLLAQAYLRAERVNAALGVLHEMEHPDPLLFTQCYVKEGSSPDKVIYYGEKALENAPHNDRLHLHLFNAYLALAKKQEHDAYTQYAADHLSAVIDIYPVSLENRLWLAHFYAKEAPNRAISLLESLFEVESNWKRFDHEALILCRLYHIQGESVKARPLLEYLVGLDQASREEAQILLGEVYLDLDMPSEAETLFSQLDTPAAALYLARLHVAEVPEESLKRLHLLMVRRSLATEPLHLEAALDYAHFSAATAPEKEQNEQLLAELLAVKELFTTSDDIVSKDYHESRALLPEKEALYQAYMRYLDACIYLAQSKLAKDHREARAKSQAARSLFTTLRQGKYAQTRYLIDHARAGLHER